MDLGLAHIALTVTDSNRSADFYARYANLQVVHRRPAEGHNSDVLWLSDRTRPFAVVLLPQAVASARLSAPLNHLGIAVASRHEVDTRISRASDEGLTTLGPFDSGPPVGYWGTIDDPDGHALELSFGQEVALTVETTQKP